MRPIQQLKALQHVRMLQNLAGYIALRLESPMRLQVCELVFCDVNYPQTAVVSFITSHVVLKVCAHL